MVTGRSGGAAGAAEGTPGRFAHPAHQYAGEGDEDAVDEEAARRRGEDAHGLDKVHRDGEPHPGAAAQQLPDAADDEEGQGEDPCPGRT